jgi:CRISPR-associated protein Csm1
MTSKQLVYLAGLLHDIGKFYQRADDHGTKKSDLLSPKVKALEDLFCPPAKAQGQGRTHKHVLWTFQFFEDHRALLLRFLTESEIEQLATLSASHHWPNRQNPLHTLLQLADHLASGMDRESLDSKDAASEATSDTNDQTWESFKDLRLRPIFADLNLKQISDRPDQYREGIVALSLDKDQVMPVDKATLVHGKNQYKELWDKFGKELQKLQTGTVESFSETLLTLLQTHTTGVPASTVDYPDTSLFDHAKSVAALAVCLHDWLLASQQLDNPQLLLASEAQPFLLVGGQLVGIQSFIYSIIGTKAAKNLKGRSFYLELLTDAAASFLLKELDLPNGNIVYNSGGNFYLLAPNTDSVKTKLAQAQESIQNQLFEKHNTELAMVFAQVPISKADLMHKKISERWSALHEALGKAKSRKLGTVLANNFSNLFDPQEIGGIKERDAITGAEISGTAIDLDGGATRISQTTQEQILLGTWLKQTDFLLETNKETNFFGLNNGTFANQISRLRLLGLTFYLLPQQELNKKVSRYTERNDLAVRVCAINRFDLPLTNAGASVSYSTKLYGGNHYPTVKLSGGSEEPKTFAEMAGQAEDDRRYETEFAEAPFKRLGVLRMDVDNLGQVFQSGFAEPKRTLARYAALSRKLDLFFKGYLNTILASKPGYTENLQLIYAGGDDLFAVGRWDAVIDFAAEVRCEFRRFVCGREEMGISGGIVLVPPKFPIAKAAQMAGDAERKAKQFGNGAKNALCLFGETVSWDDEFAKVKELKDKMVQLRQTGGLSAGFLQQLMRYQQIKNRHLANPQYANQPDLSYIWHCAYAIGRYKERSKGTGADLLGFLEQTKQDLFTNQRNFDLYALAARWAELQTRTEKKQATT